MGLIDFQIYLQNPLKVYFAGEPIYGQVVIQLNEPKNMSKIKVVLRGKGEVHWTETKTESRRNSNGSHRQEQVREHYTASENYLEQEVVVHHGPNLGSGHHVFPFSFTTPSSLPSSFENRHGHVRYFLKADIVRDWKWNHKVKTHITINSIHDLNMHPSAKQSGQNRDYKNLCCFCCKSGPISALIATNRTGYVPGELIGFCAEVDNQSNRAMSGSFLNLIEVVTFKTSRKNKTESRVVAEIRRPGIGPGTQDMWEDVKMKVPALPPTNLGGSCSIISVQYKLDFHVEPSGMSFDLVVSVPIIIGTIPLSEYIPSLAPPSLEYQQAIPAPSYNQAAAAPPYMPGQSGMAPPPGGIAPYHSGLDPPPLGMVPYPGGDAPPPTFGMVPYPGGDAPPPTFGMAPPPDGMAPPPPYGMVAPNAYNPSTPPALDKFNAYPNLPPPTYSESVWGTTNVRHQEDDEHTQGDFNFVPRYVLYNTNY